MNMKNIKTMMKKLVRNEMKELVKTIDKRMENEKTNDDDSVVMKRNKGVTFDSDMMNSRLEENKKTTNGKDIEFDPNLRPAKQQQQKRNRVYEIYISQFEKGTQIQIIEQHILKNTNLSEEVFNIEEIRSNSTKRSSNYIAFKITTLKEQAYDDIMQIWEPHFSARDFRPSTSERPTNSFLVGPSMNDMGYGRSEYTPNAPYNNEKQNEKVHQRDKQQYTMNTQMNRNRDEHNRTPTQNNYEGSATPSRYYYSGGKRGAMSQYEGRLERSHHYQQQTPHNYQHTNTNIRSQRYQQQSQTPQKQQHTNTRTNFFGQENQSQQYRRVIENQTARRSNTYNIERPNNTIKYRYQQNLNKRE